METLTMKKIFMLCSEKGKSIEKLQEWGVFATEGELKCPDCSGTMKLVPNKSEEGCYSRFCNKVSKRRQKKVTCNKRFSFRKDTFLSKSKLTIEQIMMLVRLWCSEVDLKFIEAQVGLSKTTAVDWNSFCREVVIAHCKREEKPIGGPDMTVEIDESKLGKRKYHKAHPVEGQWVFGGVCRESGDLFLVPVEKRDNLTLKPLIEKWILPGSIIISDCWKAYDKLDEAKYRHLTVNHSVNYKDPVTGAHTNQIEGLWRHIKCSLPVYNRRKDFFVGYLSKFIFINFCKRHGLDPTLEFFKAAAVLYNPYKGITDETEKHLVVENQDEANEDEDNESADEGHEDYDEDSTDEGNEDEDEENGEFEAREDEDEDGENGEFEAREE